MILARPSPQHPGPTASRTPHSVEHRPRRTVLGWRYKQARSKHAVAYRWRWRRTYFTLREDRLHEAQTEPSLTHTGPHAGLASHILSAATVHQRDFPRTTRTQHRTRYVQVRILQCSVSTEQTYGKHVYAPLPSSWIDYNRTSAMQHDEFKDERGR